MYIINRYINTHRSHQPLIIRSSLILAVSVTFPLAAVAGGHAGGASACAAPNHLSHTNPSGPHQVQLRSDADARLLGDHCTLAKIKAANGNHVPAWPAGAAICLPADCELGHASDDHNARTDRQAAGIPTFSDRLASGKEGACKYLAHLSTWAKDNRVKAAMGGAAVHFATIDGICHLIAHGVSELKPEWHLDGHSISTACTGLAGVTLAGAHAAAHGLVCTETGALQGGAGGHH